jgi:hypothetical protein
MMTRRRAVQINPNKTKPGQIKPSKIAWCNLVLFVRIGTFQWVTANPNKKISPWSLLRTPHLTLTHGGFSEFSIFRRLALILLSSKDLLAHESAAAFTKQDPAAKSDAHPSRAEIECFELGCRGLEKAVQSAWTRVIETDRRQKAGRWPFDPGTRTAA